MGVEIERKYLVSNDGYKSGYTRKSEYRQGYLSTDKERVVRIRSINGQGFITIKGKNKGCIRSEFEYEIPSDDTDKLLDMCLPPLIEKTRYLYPFDGHIWEIDEFHGANEGLIVAEIELKSEDESYRLPPFIGKEVTDDTRYYNSNLIAHPYREWNKE
jgi:adenylate cyclase